MYTGNNRLETNATPTEIQYKDVNFVLTTEITPSASNSRNVITKNTFHDMSSPMKINKFIIEGPVSVFDVARYVLSKIGTISTMKLHKLLYYCQAWNLVWEDQPLFIQPIEAWINGPVIRDLFYFHKGQYFITYEYFTIGTESSLSQTQIDNINEVLRFYGDKTSQWLVDQTHSEKPWQEARIGMGFDDRGAREITLSSMQDYYSSL